MNRRYIGPFAGFMSLVAVFSAGLLAGPPGSLAPLAVAQESSPTVSAPAKPATKISKKIRNCDPVLVSGITNECAGTGDPLGFAGEAEQAGLSEHPLALELSDLPKDRYGLIDWATAIKEKKISPLGSLDPKAKPVPGMNMDIAVFTKSQFMPDVIFPHYVHTLWLSCINCHPSIFPMDAKKANEMMTMPKISAGEFCGRCHNRIAFPLGDCLRCHTKPKDIPPIDPNYKGKLQHAKGK